MVEIRLASLRHVAGIVEVHRSDLHSTRVWTPEGWREASPGDLDPCQWVLNGGPWMSVETCAIHVNNLLTQGQIPLVALEGDRVLGEVELILGDEGGRRGLVAHLSVIEVHRDFRGRGVGRP
ncbi:MAG: GNAT family N-acetyltransferase, partial [Candidatus Korarchaeota archaeon]|nr:GNAT family N-acetyltransferase [Candidatus Korarchaeota archaeon]